MTNLRKLIGIIPKILFALTLAFALLNVTSCENMLDFGKGSQGSTPTQPSNPDDNNSQTTEPTVPPKNHYSDYENFNPANYVIENETGKPDSEVAKWKELIWLMYAEKEHVGDWTANFIKTNKIKTIQKDGYYMHPSELDRFYVQMQDHWLSHYNDNIVDDNEKAEWRDSEFRLFTHETMHLVQYKNNFFNLMTGMRPDICAAFYLLHEFLPYFYANGRDLEADISTDMKNAVETQSKYMVLAKNLLAYGAGDTDGYYAYLNGAFAKDPSLPANYLFHSNWAFSGYTQSAISSVYGISMTPPLVMASKEDILKVARALLACRDPKQAGVTDDALWATFDALRKVVTGENKYLLFTDDYNSVRVNRESFNNFQEFIAEWDAAYAAQARSVVQTQSVSPSISMKLAAAIVW